MPNIIIFFYIECKLKLQCLTILWKSRSVGSEGGRGVEKLCCPSRVCRVFWNNSFLLVCYYCWCGYNIGRYCKYAIVPWDTLLQEHKLFLPISLLVPMPMEAEVLWSRCLVHSLQPHETAHFWLCWFLVKMKIDLQMSGFKKPTGIFINMVSINLLAFSAFAYCQKN